ncbi:hypothetical protein B0T18DRAFT_424249 [Schizothecium vesticola]|uniref:PARP catalytic domain-containing protein n=1 Tax=Schizothecium vesticola TaxID=314040 RepID=A0AA40KCI5_9PEZI|nr:hypothetical protein B0T18DRAFT_424249 [Schizothecium vesticola]
MPKPKTMDLPMRRLSPRDRDYKLYAKKFKDNWLHPGKTAEVVHIYLASGTDLRSSVRAQKFANTLKTKGGGAFLTRFHGTQRSCQIGDGPNSDIEPCGKADCHLCSILKEGFDLKRAKTTGMFGPGIYSTTCSSKADIYAKNNHIRSNRRIILICRLVGDKPQMLSVAEQNRRAPDPNFNCVEAVVNVNGGRVQYPETVVYDADMIIPVGFIVYKRS